MREARRGAAAVAVLVATAFGAAAGGPPPQTQPQAPAQESAPAPAAPQAIAQPAGAQPAAAAPQSVARPAPVAHVAKLAPPVGMVRYERPVFRNGHYVLWHGAWRGGMRAFRAAAVKPEPPEAAKPKQDFLILVDSADAAATRMAGELAAATQDGPSHMRAEPGRTSTAALERTSGADSADLAIVPTDGLIAAASPSDWRVKNPYLLRLCSEPIEVVAARGITELGQLAGRKVAVGPADGAAATSAAIVFSRLNVAPTLVHEDMPQALAGLAAGSLDAVFIVGAESSKSLAELDKGGRFHVVSIPYEPALQGLYQPIRLSAREQPDLIGGDESVDTIGVTTALVAIDAAPKSPRAARLAPLAEQIISGFDRLRAEDPDLKDVNLTARINGWPRFDAAQRWVEENQSAPNAAFDAFRDMAQSAGGDASAADSDRLYDSLMRWSRAGQ